MEANKLPLVNHPASLQDIVYMKAPSRPLVKIGALSYTGNVHIWDYQEFGHERQEDGVVEIGRCCSLGTNIHIYIYGNHDHLSVTTSLLMPLIDYKHLLSSPGAREDVRIGNDFWIGNDVWILSGVTICDGAVIGTMAVIAKDIPPYAAVIGNPAKILSIGFLKFK
jgi:virginiamycin A acetyltransferase